MFFLLFFLISCFKFKENLKGYREVGEFYIKVSSDGTPIVGAKVELFSSESSFIPFKESFGDYFFQLPSGIYTVIVSREGYYSSSLQITIVNKGSCFIKGSNEVILKKSAIPKKIESVGINKLFLKSMHNNLCLESKNDLFTFDMEHLGAYDSLYGKFIVLLNGDEVEVLLNNRSIDSLSIIVEHRISLQLDESSPSGMVSTSSDKLVISDESVVSDGELLTYRSKVYAAKSGVYSVDVKLTIGSLEERFNLLLNYSGSSICSPFLFKYKYGELVIRSKFLSRLPFKISYSGALVECSRGDGRVNIEFLTREYGDLALNIRGYEPIKFSTSKYEEVELTIDSFVFKALKESDSKYILNKIGDRYYVIPEFRCHLFDRLELKELYQLNISKDEESIVNQQIVKLKLSSIDPLPISIYFGRILLSKRAGSSIGLNGAIFLNVNDRVINSILTSINLDDIFNLTFRFKLYLGMNEIHLKGANIDLIRSKGVYKLNFEPNISIVKHGESIYLDLFKANRNLSSINMSKNSYRVVMDIIAHYTQESVELDRDIPIVCESRAISRSTIISKSPSFCSIYQTLLEVEPVFSSQTFSFIMSYSSREVYLKEDEFYENFLTNRDNEKELIFSTSNISAGGELGSNFHQHVRESRSEKLEDQRYNSSLMASGFVGLFSSTPLAQLISLGSFLLGSFNSMKSRYKKDSSSWSSYFTDANGKPIETISLNAQQNYSVEWKMYVFVDRDQEVNLNPVTIGDGADIRVIIELVGNKQNIKLIGSSESLNLTRGWYYFRLKIQKMGRVSDSWSVKVNIPFKIYRASDKVLKKANGMIEIY